MIATVLGKTGSGKSRFLTEEFVIKRLLEDDDTYIITQLPLNLGELNAYFAEQYPGKPVHCLDRIRILTHAEAREFFCHREIGVDLPMPTKAQLDAPETGWLKPWDEAATRSRWRITYIIDEAQIYFDSREWAKVGRAMNDVISQHRKLKIDDIIFATQFLKQLELRLREHSALFYECMNWGMRSVGWFKAPRIFTVRVTSKPPPCEADYTIKAKLDLKVAKCYDTTAGVGIQGGRKPEVIKRRGMNMLWLIPIILVAIVLLAYGPEAVFAWATGAKKKPSESHSAEGAHVGPARAVTVSAKGLVLAAEGGTGRGADRSGERVAEAPAVVEKSPEVYPTGWAKLGRRFIVQLSDGSRLTEEDMDRPGGKIAYYGLNFIELKTGLRVRYKPLATPILPNRGDVLHAYGQPYVYGESVGGLSKPLPVPEVVPPPPPAK